MLSSDRKAPYRNAVIAAALAFSALLAGCTARPLYSEPAIDALNAVQADASDDIIASAGGLTMTASYLVTDTVTGEQVASGNRSVNASYDRPGQQFADTRARRDAENRAARELAEFVRLSLLQDLARLGAQ